MLKYTHLKCFSAVIVVYNKNHAAGNLQDYDTVKTLLHYEITLFVCPLWKMNGPYISFIRESTCATAWKLIVCS